MFITGKIFSFTFQFRPVEVLRAFENYQERVDK